MKRKASTPTKLALPFGPFRRAGHAIISTTTETISTKKHVAAVAAQQRSKLSIEAKRKVTFCDDVG
jgi:hypothetical protein